MPEGTKRKIGVGPGIIRDAATDAIDVLTGQLLQRAKENGGGLTAPAIRETVAQFKQQPNALLTEIFETYWKRCRDSAESAHWTSARKFHFERIMVKCFSGLLPRKDETIEAGRHLSRRIIPGFIHALQQMMGPEIYEQYGDRATSLVDTLRAVHGEGFTWNEVYADPSCQAVVEEVLVGITQHFADIGKRRNWMIDVIDAHMPATSNEGEKAWHFGDGAFHTLMNALYGALREQIKSPEGRDNIKSRHGDDRVLALEKMFADLTQDHADLLQAGRL